MPVPCCGPKCSICCAVFSTWGFIMLGLMGLFYNMKAVAFIDDLPIDVEYWSKMGHNWQYIEDLYFDNSITCFIAMGCYMFTFTLSIIMFFINKMMK